MRSLVCLLLLAAAVPAAAQQVEIIGIDHTGTITWSNSPTPLYCGVEGKWDLRHTWLPLLDWNVLVTSSVTNSSTDVPELWSGLDNMLRNLTGGDGINALFFRVVASQSPLEPRHATNIITLVNASTSVLANVEIGSVDGGTQAPVTNLPALLQGNSSQPIPIAQEIPLPIFGSVTNIIAPLVVDPPMQEGWYVSYDHDGSNRVVESMVIPFGEPEKHIRVTVSNATVTVLYEWVGFSGTLPP